MLTYDCTSLNPVAGVVVRARNRGQLAIGWGNVAELITQIGATLVQGGTGSHSLIVNYIV